jgi:hypothetical protein
MKSVMKFVGYVVLEQQRNTETRAEFLVVSQAVGSRTPHEHKSEAVQAARFAARETGEPVYIAKLFARIDPVIETGLVTIGSEEPPRED